MKPITHSRASLARATVSRAKPSRAIAVGAGLLLATTLAGCSSAIDYIPTALGGLPEGVPARPTTPHQYPYVHDMPPKREDTALSEAERARLRNDLTGVRTRTGQIPAADTTGTTTGGAAKP
jgi:hypothetical protein